MEEDQEQIRRILVQGINANSVLIDSILTKFTKVNFKKNDFFLNEGELSDNYLILTSGFLRAYFLDINNDEVTTKFYASPEGVFDISSFFRKEPSNINIVALSDCIGWILPYQAFQYYFHSYPEFREFGRLRLVSAYYLLEQRTISLLKENAEQRYLKMIHEFPEIFEVAPLKSIASYLGITDSSLSRIRKSITKHGL